MSSSGFAKREREKAKRERAERKRERRDERRTDTGEVDVAAPARAQADVLASLAALHDAHEAGRMSFEQFEAAKADLIAQLHI